MSELMHAQRAFAAALRAEGGEALALTALTGDAVRNRHLLAVYRGNAVANARKALQLTYPVIEKIVGEDFFAGLCREYWRLEPSRSGDLNEYGSTFAEFLRSFEPAQEMPYLADVAALEWSVSRAAQALDHQALPLSELSRVAPEHMADLRFVVQPALRLHTSAWPVASIWLQHQPEWHAEIDIDLALPECAAVHRSGLRATVMSLSAAERVFWRCAQAGETLGLMLDEAFATDAAFDVQAALMRGFAAGFVCSLPQAALMQIG